MSIFVCWQVFLDMAVLVEAQGEMLDNIEANVGKVRACVPASVCPVGPV